MTDTNTLLVKSARHATARRYTCACLALGLSAGLMAPVCTKIARAADDAQAVDPVNVKGTTTPPDAAVPTYVAPKVPPVMAPVVNAPTADPTTEPHVTITQSPTPPATGPADAVGQAITPPDISKSAGPTPTLTPTVETQPAPTAPTEMAQPTTPTTPTTPATPPSTEMAATPTTTPVRPIEPQMLTTPTVSIPASTAAATAADGKSYPITGLRISYFKDTTGQPPINELLHTPVTLGVTKDGFVSAWTIQNGVRVAKPGVPLVTLPLGEIGLSSPRKIYRSAIEACYLQVVRFYNAKGIIGVFVVVDSKDIDASDNDIRPADRSTLQFIVVTSNVKQVRTLATGDRAKEGERVDLPQHRKIRENSPLQAEAGHESLLNKDALDNYVLRLNRQPGRRVDVAVSGTGQLGEVNLDYLVSESRPWYVYAQASNTGTAQTSTWRERFGFVDNQLTGHDDILTFDYSTAGFEASHALIGSYELPFFSFDRLRYRIYGSWNEYTASDVGQSKEKFTGSEWTVGNELNVNIFQHRELFVDLVPGIRGQNVTTDGVNGHGDATFLSPYLSLRLER